MKIIEEDHRSKKTFVKSSSIKQDLPATKCERDTNISYIYSSPISQSNAVPKQFLYNCVSSKNINNDNGNNSENKTYTCRST